MNILIAQSAKLGDMVCTTPMFRAVKKKYPHARLFVLGNATNKEVVAGNQHVDEYLVEPQESQALLALLREKQIDVAICTTPYPRMLWCFLRARIQKIIVPHVVGGFSPYATKTYRLLSLFVTRVPFRFGVYMPQQYLHLLGPLGVRETDTTKELFFSEEGKKRVKELLPVGPFYIGIAPGVGNGIKKWGGERFAEVATTLALAHDATIVVVGGPKDAGEINSMLTHLSKKVRMIDLSQKLSIDELKAAISLLTLFIAVDTGPVYIAEAFGIPTVDIVGPMDEREQPPRGEKHVVVVPERAEPALHILNASLYDTAEARRQAGAVSPRMVIDATEVLITKIR